MDIQFLAQRRGFSGWYFKHVADGRTLCLIPGVSTYDGVAFIQVVADDVCRFVRYSIDDVDVSPAEVRVGDSFFSANRVEAAIHDGPFSLTGSVVYGPITPLKADVMGPLRFLPRLECRHSIVSMKHRLTGGFTVNGEPVDLTGGTGYIEGDMGRSFPRRYAWTQCNAFGRADCAVTAAVADIPYMGMRFRGCFAAIVYNGAQLRFATYNGAKAMQCNPRGVKIRRGKYVFCADVEEVRPLPLKAPTLHGMTRLIHESAAATIRYRLYHGKSPIFDLTSDAASFEYVR